MRTLRTMIALVLVMVFVVGLFLFWPDSHFRFRHKSKRYYIEFTKACDFILEQHPLGTNQFIEVCVTDSSLPIIIRDFHPLKINVQAQRVWILHGGALEFGIAWEQEFARTSGL